jgi:hypothetical protein
VHNVLRSQQNKSGVQVKFLFRKAFQHKNQLILILVLGLLHGLIYVFMIPPWWHHEEPGHFEYAWLIANRPGWPQPGDYDNSLRRQIVKSMTAIGQENLYNVSNRNLDDDPINLGGSPVGRKVVYYWVVSWPLRLVRGQAVLLQLYVARLTSLGLFLLSLWLAWLLMGELVTDRHPLRWMVPVFLALLPGYVDNMTSVHDDVIGAVVAAWYLWLSVRAIKKGFSVLSLLGWLVSLGLCVVARETTMTLVLLAPIVLLSRALKTRAVPLMGVGLLLLVLLLGTQILTFRDASQWYYFPAQQTSDRIKNAQTPFGEYVFSISAESSAGMEFGQSFAPDSIKPLRKKTLTLGVWIWADAPVQVSLPIITYRTPDGLAGSAQQIIQIGTTPAFYVTTFHIPYEAGHTWLTPLPAYPEGIAHIYYDGFVLAEGAHSSAPPTFNDEQLLSGTWDGQPFHNIIRNPSAEHAWFGLRDWVNKFQKLSYLDLALFLQTSQDLQGFGWYHRLAASSLFQSFWGRGAAAQVPLVGGSSYTFLQLLSLFFALGILHYSLRDRSLFMKPEIFFLAGVLLVVWIPTFFRGTYWVFYFVPLVPYARYAFPAFIPTALLICTGCLEALQWVRVHFALPESFPVLAFSAFMAGLACYAIFSFGGHFYPWLLNVSYLVFFLAVISIFFIVLRGYAAHQKSLDR